MPSQDGIYHHHVRSCPIFAGNIFFPLKHIFKSKDSFCWMVNLVLSVRPQVVPGCASVALWCRLSHDFLGERCFSGLKLLDDNLVF